MRRNISEDEIQKIETYEDEHGMTILLSSDKQDKDVWVVSFKEKDSALIDEILA